MASSLSTETNMLTPSRVVALVPRSHPGFPLYLTNVLVLPNSTALVNPDVPRPPYSKQMLHLQFSPASVFMLPLSPASPLTLVTLLCLLVLYLHFKCYEFLMLSCWLHPYSQNSSWAELTHTHSHPSDS